MAEDRVGDEWTLHLYGGPVPSGRFVPAVMGDLGDLEERERKLKVRTGQPFLLPPAGPPDVDVLLYMNSGSFKRLSMNSQLAYAYDLRVHLSYLTSQGVDWRDVTEDDLVNYVHWRRDDEENKRRVSGAKLARELASARRFYGWQERRGLLRAGAVPEMTARALQPRDVRQVRMKWLTDDEYEEWCNLGLRGHSKDRDRRIRNVSRNIAFAEALWASGLRLREGGSLLLLELPKSTRPYPQVRLGGAVSKTVACDYWISRTALDLIEVYRNSGRDGAIRRARAAGRYDRLTGIMIAQSLTASRRLVYEDENGAQGVVPLDGLTAAQRLTVYVEGDDGLEPAMVWLTDAGMPMPHTTWSKVFETASNRCEAAGSDVRCYPHKLRHTFAMRWLVKFTKDFEDRMGITPQERQLYRKDLGDPLVMVQTLLRHSSVETTERNYLEPAQGLKVDQFMNRDNEDVSAADILAETLHSYQAATGAIQ